MKIIFLFFDGLGLGDNDRSNPFSYTPTPNLKSLLGGQPFTREAAGFRGDKVALIALDATLGVAGLPQSATGQAAIFTGKNVPKLLGYHVHGLPGRRIKEQLAAHGMFKQLQQKGFRCFFLNGYRPQFFQKLKNGDLRGFSCSTLITYYAGLPFRSLKDVEEGNALYADITNSTLRQMGFSLPEITAKEAARRLVALSRNYDLVLFEHFQTDLAGHRADPEAAGKSVDLIDDFLGHIIRYLPEDTLLFMTSDHGNLENTSSNVHTLNPVPALFYGPFDYSCVQQMKDLTDIFPTLLHHLQSNIIAGREEKGKKIV